MTKIVLASVIVAALAIGGIAAAIAIPSGTTDRRPASVAQSAQLNCPGQPGPCSVSSATTPSATTSSPPSPATPGVNASSRYCDQNIQATPRASCPFAENVFVAVWRGYEASGTVPSNVSANSPTTGQSYELACGMRAEVADVVCNVLTDESAAVQFPLRAVVVYQGPQASAPGASATNQSVPTLVVGSWSGTKPTTIDFSGDAGNIVTGITWSSWTAAEAIGQGTSILQSCVPNCAQGSNTPVATMITLSIPQNGSFTQMTESRNGMTSVASYGSNSWPMSAS